MWELYYKESWALKNWCFWTVVLKTFESSLDCKEIQPVILKEITSECWLEGLMLKLKLQYFGHLMRRADSLEKTLMLGKTEGGRRRGQQRMKWLDGITDSTDMSLGRTELNWTKETFSQAGSVGNFGISEGSITEKKKKITTEFALKNYQSKSGWHACIHPQQVGTGCGGMNFTVGPKGKDKSWMPWGHSEETNVTQIATQQQPKLRECQKDKGKQKAFPMGRL